MHIALPDGTALTVTISIGVSTYRRGEQGIAAALARADSALYEAKAAGRNRIATMEGAAPAVG